MSGKQTAKKAVEILCNKGLGFQELSDLQRRKLFLTFAQYDMVLYGKAFDVVRCPKKVDFNDEKDIFKNFDHITIYEVKSTNQERIPKNFKGYFFDLTTAELLVAQSLGDKFKFAFVHTLTEEFIELTINQVFAKAKRIYPKWAITLN